MRYALFLIWLRWAVWVTLFSLLSAVLLAVGVTLFFYLAKGAVALQEETVYALKDIGMFWFGVFWSLMLPIGMFLGMKQLFVRGSDGYKLQQYTCDKKPMESVSYNDLLKPWRKWLFLMVWGVAAGIILMMALQFAVRGEVALVRWWSGYSLYMLLMLSSWATLALMVKRCPSIEMERC
ncbi:MAG: hypothetical protein DSZ03_06435 [Sulfurimonas sp.]|nr:MAG: hypothetical protein DSZ03_06435 [Sulfurimonas sp.]